MTSVQGRATKSDAVAAEGENQHGSSGLGAVQERKAITAMTVKLAALFWLCVLLSDSLLWGIVGTDPIASAFGKVILNSFGAALTLVVTVLLFRIRAASIFTKVVVAFTFSILAAAIYSVFDIFIYLWMARPAQWVFDNVQFGHTMISSTAMFFGWSCLYIAMIYSFDVRDRERSLALAREEALAAQMRALRYQINPHFLFNTLNSAMGLVEEGATARAQRMMFSLSTFLRQTLELDPMKDVTLAAELELQEDYLEIERERFPDRMRFTIDVDEAALDALVPNLILQPLVENAVRHGVEPCTGEVGIRITAWRDGAQLGIRVENDLCSIDEGASRSGGRIGLRNVAERLAARFGSESSFETKLTPALFRAEIRLPWAV
ncbi:sensor histidine kinase [Sphingopyxis sp.]|uniref:sensor histidine kinase n=1 Tax=Sphingopyxis sp. TaxID=1908224 RepID=UPI003D14BD36